MVLACAREGAQRALRHAGAFSRNHGCGSADTDPVMATTFVGATRPKQLAATGVGPDRDLRLAEQVDVYVATDPGEGRLSVRLYPPEGLDEIFLRVSVDGRTRFESGVRFSEADPEPVMYVDRGVAPGTEVAVEVTVGRATAHSVHEAESTADPIGCWGRIRGFLGR